MSFSMRKLDVLRPIEIVRYTKREYDQLVTLLTSESLIIKQRLKTIYARLTIPLKRQRFCEKIMT